MRIMRRFTQPDLMRTVPNASEDSIRKFVRMLVCHGFIVKTGAKPSGHPGDYQSYQLSRDIGPKPPTRCAVCGGLLSVKTCITLGKKETKKEGNTEKQTVATTETPEVTHDAA